MNWTLGLCVLVLAHPVALHRLEPAPDPPPIPRDAPDLEDAITRAAVAFAAGEESYAAAEFDQAVHSFSEAQDLAPHPHTQFNLGLALMQAKRWAEAWGTFEALLDEPISDGFRRDVRDQLTTLRSFVSFLSVEADPSHVLCLDGQRFDGQRTLVPPGPHHLDLDAWKSNVVLKPGDDVHLDLRFVATQGDRPRTARRPPRSLTPLLATSSATAGLGFALSLSAAIHGDSETRRGLAGAAAGATSVAVATAIGALVIHRRNRRAQQRRPSRPPPRPAC